MHGKFSIFKIKERVAISQKKVYISKGGDM